MNCTDINTHIDDYLDAQLSQQDQLAFEQHVSKCADCRQDVELAKSILTDLKNLSIPQPSANFEQRVFAEVSRQHKDHHRFTFATGFATAAVASLAIWFASTVMVPDALIEQPLMISVAMNQTQTVRLLFDSQIDIEQAKLSIDLPDNMQLDGYPGHRALSWQINLIKGQNILALPVMAIQHGRGELVAQVSYGDKVKTYRLVLMTAKNGADYYQFEQLKTA